MKKNIKLIMLVLLFLIVIVVGLLFLNNIKKNNQYKKLIDDIKNASSKYITDTLEENYPIIIKIGNLKDENYLPFELINPKTNKHLSDESYALVSGNNENYELNLYDILDKNVSKNCIVKLNGLNEIQVRIGENYIEPGIEISEKGEILSYSVQYFHKGSEVFSIDSSIPKNYVAVYTALNSNGYLINIRRNIIVQ